MTAVTPPTDPTVSPTSVSEEISEYDEVRKIDLKNPVVAGLLAWLVPGLGHYYQGRYAKAVLFFCCIVPTFVIGCALGSGKDTGYARNVYWSWRKGDMRLHFIPQACIGSAAVPAGLQAMRAKAGRPTLFGRFMAPPLLEPDDKEGVGPTQSVIFQRLPYIDLGLYITMIAGLMNLLAIFDAIDGPLVYRSEEEEEEEEKAPPEAEAAANPV